MYCITARPSARAVDVNDYASAFMTTCYHLKDWLHEGGWINEKYVTSFVRHRTEHLSICRDLANAVKHYCLRDDKGYLHVRRYGKGHDNFTTFISSTGANRETDIPDHVSPQPSGRQLESGQYVIEVMSKDGKVQSFDLMDFVDGCIIGLEVPDRLE